MIITVMFPVLPTNLSVNGKYDLGNEEKPKIILGAGIENALGVQAEVNVIPLRIYLPKKTGSEQLDE